MKNTNQTFNMKRFGKYAAGQLEMNYKKILIGAAMASVILFLILFLIINKVDGKWVSFSWFLMISISYILGGFLYVGKAFPILRKKEEMLIFYLTPASSFEKFIYELFERIGLFIVLFPLLFVGIANLATEAIIITRDYFGLFSDIDRLSKDFLSEILSQSVLKQIISAGFLIFSLAFASTATFRKHPMAKMIFIFGLYLLFAPTYANYFAAENSWYSVHVQSLELNTRRFVFSATMSFVALIALVYAYFRVKEKEVK